MSDYDPSEIATADTWKQLQDAGLTDKQSLDNLYLHSRDQQNQETADTISKAVENDPNVADIANRVGSNIGMSVPQGGESSAAALPPQGAPQSGPLPDTTPAATPTPASDPAPQSFHGTSGSWNGKAFPAKAADIDSVDKPDGPNADTMALSGISNEIDGAILKAKQDAATATQLAAINNRGAQEIDQLDAQRQAQQAAHRAQIDGQLDKIQKATDDFSNTQIDPNHFWATRDTSQKVSALVGIILSNAGHGTGATDALNQAVKDDIDVQKANANLKLQGLSAQNSVFEKMREITGDDNDAAKLTQASALQRIAMQLKGASSMGDANNSGQLLQTIGQLQEKAKTLKIEVGSNADAQLQQKLFGGGTKDPNYGLAGPEDNPKADRGLQTPWGPVGRAPDKTELLKEMSGVDTVNSGFNELISAVQKYGAWNEVPSTEKAKLETIAAATAPAARNVMLRTGKITDQELDTMNTIIGNPAKAFTIPALALTRLQTAQSIYQQGANEILRGYNLKPHFQATPTTIAPGSSQ